MCLLVALEPIRVERPPRREVRDDVDDAYAHVDDVRRRLQEVYSPEWKSTCERDDAAVPAQSSGEERAVKF